MPLAEPDATSSLSKSPEDKWQKPYDCTNLAQIVPFPLPGPPVRNKTDSDHCLKSKFSWGKPKGQTQHKKTFRDAQAGLKRKNLV